MRKYILILLIFAVNFASNAQVETTIFSGGNGFKEFSFLNNINKEEIPLYEMPSFNLDSIIQEEKELDEKGIGRPFRFGYAFDVNYGMEHGKWFELENKNIWSIRFKSDGAYTLNFRFFDLKLYNNSELYIYNSDGTVIYGPVTYKENATEEFNSIGTDLIAGEEAIIQIIEPKTSKQISFLKISRVVHGFVDHYKNILLSNNKIDNNFQAATLNCHIDVMCYSDWIESSKGIGITMKNDVYWCSGALLNNQTGTNRPYF